LRRYIKALDVTGAAGGIGTECGARSAAAATEAADAHCSEGTFKGHSVGSGRAADAAVCAAEAADLCQRAQIHALILAGNVDVAEEHLHTSYPRVFESDRMSDVSDVRMSVVSDVRLHLACQRFVEIIRAGQLSSALEYAQSDLAPCVGLDPRWGRCRLKPCLHARNNTSFALVPFILFLRSSSPKALHMVSLTNPDSMPLCDTL